MKLIRLVVKNFRGIAELDWATNQRPLCCLIGPGDSLKSTVLDAVEAALSSRWFAFSESDFHACDTKRQIVIEVTVGELSQALLSDEKFGLYVRGLSTEGDLRDEPEDGDEPLLTVRLTVDAAMEPLWEVINDRAQYPRTMSNRDRALFRVVRLSGEDARHLTWGQGSVLSKLTGANEEAAQQLSNAYQMAKASAGLDKIPELTSVALEAEKRAKAIGAQVSDKYVPGLELARGGFSSGSIALHDGVVPLRLAGTGTRRLATLAVQQAAIDEGAILLVDEIEQGLEPHRVIGAILHLRSSQDEAKKAGRATGQILMTTHSEVALSELEPSALFVCRPEAKKRLHILYPGDDASLKRVLKKSPRALFAKKVLVCEGDTELGLMLGLRELFPLRHDGVSIEQLGVSIVDGGGSEAPLVASAIGALGFRTALFRDSDVKVPTKQQALLDKANVKTITYHIDIAIETALFQAMADDEGIDHLLEVAKGHKGDSTVLDQIHKAIPEAPPPSLATRFEKWGLVTGLERDELISRLATIALENSWFKNKFVARALAPHVDAMVHRKPLSPLAPVLARNEHWIYG
jgi:hypothetical protein